MSHNRPNRVFFQPATLITSTVLTAFLSSGAGCSRSSAANTQNKQAPAATQVETVQPTRKTIQRTSDQPGHVEAFEETPLYAKISGFVRMVNADIGDSVKEGQVLAELSVPEMVQELKQKDALVQQANADVAQAEAAVKAAAAAVATARAKITEAEATTKRSNAEYARAKAELARIERLVTENAIHKKLAEEAESEFEAADAARDEAAAKIESARAGLQEAEAKLTRAKADVVAATARVAVAEANRGFAETMLQYAKVTAPYDGVVTRRNIHKGHFISSTGNREPLYVVMRSDPVRIFVDVPEKDATSVKPGSRASIRVQALGSVELQGTVTRSAWALDETSRTLRSEIDVPNPDGELRPGMYAYAGIVVAEHADVLSLPASAVIKQGDKMVCCCVEGGKVVRKPITVGLNDGTSVEIVSGLDGSEQVVKANAGALTNGQSVQVKSSAK
jgi:RND family efflux transporter MFP subunit